MSARNLAATVEDGLNHPDDEMAFLAAKAALAALEKQAADAQAAADDWAQQDVWRWRHDRMEERAVRAEEARDNAEGDLVLEVNRRVRAEEALRRVGVELRKQDEWAVPLIAIVNEALAAAGADTP